MTWNIVFTKQAAKDAKKLKAAGLDKKAKRLLAIIKEDPFVNPPHYEALVGNLTGLYSRRINLHHRLVYQILRDSQDSQANTNKLSEENEQSEGTIKVIRMWTRYEGL